MKPVTGPSQRRQPQPETDTSSEALPGPPEVNLQVYPSKYTVNGCALHTVTYRTVPIYLLKHTTVLVPYKKKYYPSTSDKVDNLFLIRTCIGKKCRYLFKSGRLHKLLKQSLTWYTRRPWAGQWRSGTPPGTRPRPLSRPPQPTERRTTKL